MSLWHEPNLFFFLSTALFLCLARMLHALVFSLPNTRTNLQRSLLLFLGNGHSKKRDLSNGCPKIHNWVKKILRGGLMNYLRQMCIPRGRQQRSPSAWVGGVMELTCWGVRKTFCVLLDETHFTCRRHCLSNMI